MINGVLVQVSLTMGSVSLQIYPVVISPVPEYIIGIDIQQSESPYWFSNLRSEGYYSGNGQLEGIRTNFTWENSK